MISSIRIKRLSRHILTSFGVGGQSGKSTLAMMLAGYLIESPSAHSIAILDMASPGVGLYESFCKLYGLGESYTGSGNIDGERYILLPGTEDTLIRNLIIVDVRPEGLDSWEQQTEKICRIEEGLIVGKDFHITHVIAETNLPPNRDDMPRLIEQFREGSSVLWTAWLRSSLQEKELAENLGEIKEHYDTFNWETMHNPHLDAEKRDDDQDYEAMKSLHQRIVGGNPLNRTPVDIIALCERARVAADKKLQNNDYWSFVYEPYQDDNIPRDLLPVYRRSVRYNEVAQNRFAGLPFISEPKQLSKVLDSQADNLFSEVFAPYFNYRGY